MDLSRVRYPGPGSLQYYEEIFTDEYFASFGWPSAVSFLDTLESHCQGSSHPMLCSWEMLARELPKCQSPIEERLLVHLAESIEFEAMCSIRSQARIGKYTADLAIWTPDSSIMHDECPVVPFFLVIECDGRQFHLSEEQVAHDKAKDRALVQNGWRVVRFPGTEIWNDPSGCAEQVMEILSAHGLTL